MPSIVSPNKKDLIVFVHGFGSSAKCWDPLLSLLNQDPKIKDLFHFACFEYPTKWFNFNPLRRIPRIREIAHGLEGFLADKKYSNYEEVTLVGHSQGGLVIQAFLVRTLEDGMAERLERIRQVLLVATPNLGSTLFSTFRKFVSIISANPQERSLRVLNPEITDIREKVREKIIDAARKSATEWPVPIQAFVGNEDGVVPEASARGLFSNVASLDGDHFSIISPTSHDDRRYRTLSDALQYPKGHKHVFEIDLYEVSLKIEPLPEGYTMEAPQKRRVQTNNVAYLERSVTFSPNTTSRDLFRMRYRTRDDGCLKAVMSHDNEAPKSEQSRYDDYGREVTFDFTPKQGGTYKLNLEIYKGFEKGNRDVHFHLGQKARIKTYRFRMDLSSYLAAGYELTDGPQLHFHNQDKGDHKLCKQRTLEPPLPCTRVAGGGVWEWEIGRIREGVVDVVWDVRQVAVAA